MNEYENHNPDVLSCLASLSNDEVFTPPNIANEMLDLLPKEIWSDPKIKFLDPCCKSGVFLREIAKRLIEGLMDVYPDLQERINHICKEQLYGIAITELTALLSRRSLYCSKHANGDYSICTGDFTEEGRILFEPTHHTWSGNNCQFCGANRDNYDRPDDLEAHAYLFIHVLKPEEIFKMKFDVIVGNPPYQLSDGGNGMSAKPIYHLFVEQAMKLNPRYLTMIIPARWYAGGKGLDSFRQEMLNDDRIRVLVDFENSQDVFQGVDIAGGICYFLWDRDNRGLCSVTSHFGDQLDTKERALNEFDTFIRHGKAVQIVKKVLSVHGNNGYLDDFVSSRKPFGLPTNYEPRKTGIPCWFIQKIGLMYADPSDVDDSKGYLNKWKYIAPKAPIAGQTDFTKPVGFYYDGNTKIIKPGECCTESFIILGNFDSEKETLSFKSYILTKVVRFLLLQTVVSQDVTKKNFCFVPDLHHYSGTYTDEMLIDLWGITPDEWEFIQSRITDIGKGRDTNEQ
ncbi:type III restriction system methylase [methanogenic archaeon mixed culture ISO4-G1]|nr:type III restriction system methylase [methanogenic archaeon mixed culture ISO4-G1]